ncbi:nose resistant to fluoxetine protein 6-like [Dermacentor andersoni]|uniref:nose resistant to fluoxetine protein 6-like n=1 Tax=Dermacentor andersoni TaxID=34620 RepID=UPI0024163E5E|nr:nose resistant to fluoxetine protein 6-like [Dermacentor andersoni]
MFMKIEWYRSYQRPTETRRLFVAFTDRILWSICLAWFVFACATGRGGFVNRFLSWGAFVPLSRLSFGVYLVHSPIFTLIYYTSRERIFFSHFTLVSQCFSVVTWSYILSYFLFISCEGPTATLEKLAFMPQLQKQGSRSNEVKSEVQKNGVNSIAKSVPVDLIEHNTSKKCLNGNSLEAGVGFVESSSNECCRL